MRRCAAEECGLPGRGQRLLVEIVEGEITFSRAGQERQDGLAGNAGGGESRGNPASLHQVIVIRDLRGRARLKERLQNQHRGHLIHNLRPLAAADFRFA